MALKQNQLKGQGPLFAISERDKTRCSRTRQIWHVRHLGFATGLQNYDAFAKVKRSGRLFSELVRVLS